MSRGLVPHLSRVYWIHGQGLDKCSGEPIQANEKEYECTVVVHLIGECALAHLRGVQWKSSMCIKCLCSLMVQYNNSEGEKKPSRLAS
jgi:hypothetical protein